MEHPLDPDRRLALSYVRPARRPPIECLWQLDAALGWAVAGGSQPLTRQIKLAWWREALDGLDRSAVPAEPLLERVAGELLPCGLVGAELATLAEGWEYLAGSDPLSAGDRASYAGLRGRGLFRLSAVLLAEELDPRLETAGEAWALVDLARRSSDQAEAEAAMADVAQRMPARGPRWPVRLRPLGMLAALARRDLARGPDQVEPQGAPLRMLHMLGHRLTG